MSLDQSSEINASLNALRAAIQNGTHGLVRNLSLDLTEDKSVIVRGTALSYYGVQLAIRATRQFGDMQRLSDETQLLLSVNGTTVELLVSPPASEDIHDAVSPQDDNRRPPLTIAASA